MGDVFRGLRGPGVDSEAVEAFDVREKYARRDTRTLVLQTLVYAPSAP